MINIGFFIRRKRLIIDTFLILTALFLLIGGGLLFWASTLTMPALDSFEERKVSQSTKIYDKTGEIVLYDVHQNIRRTIVPFNEISKNVKNATIAIEDKYFYSHGAIKISSIVRAILANIFSLSDGQGGSTITQQVVKNALLSSEKTISRKLKEWILAIKLEKQISKDEILNTYLNEIPYGGNIYGIEEASLQFFGKRSSDVTLAEAAYLAALPQAPTFYSPYGQNKNRLDDRKNLVLRQMLENQFITQEEYKTAQAEKVTFKPQNKTGIKAPHFVQFVKNYLEQKYGEDMLANGGLKVITTLDYELQEKAESIVSNHAATRLKDFNATNASIVAIDPKTGGILVMVGSRDYFDKEIDGNFNIATAKRQPGSSFKPFAYSEAFNLGYTPDTVLFDVQTEFSTTCTPEGKPKGPDSNCYMPGNYDDKFRGPISLRDALAQSINIPAIKTLYLSGIKNVLNLAKSMGITTLTNPDQYGLTLVLGGGEVSLLDMTSAYSVFANEGNRNPYTPISQVLDKDGNVLEQISNQTINVLPENTALQISNILTDNTARTPSYGANSPLYFQGRDVAVKTGTTNDYRDVWIIGYTPSIAVGAWAGNNDNSPMVKKTAGLIISPMWRAFMDEVLKTVPNEKFKDPEIANSTDLKPVIRGKWQGGISTLIDKASGNLATTNTPVDFLDEKLSGGVHSILYWVDKNDPLGPRPSNPSNDSQFELWEYAVRKWVTQNGISDNPVSLPTSYDDVHTQEQAPNVSILNVSGATYSVNNLIPINLNYSGTYAFKKAEYYLNNSYLDSSTSISVPFVINPKTTNEILINNLNTLRVVVYDQMLNKKEVSFSFRVSN